MPIPEFTHLHVLVTGGAGFIGSHLVDALLEREARVRVLDNLETGRTENLAHCRDRIQFTEGDIREAETCRRICEGVTFVFHQAALGSVPRSMEDPATSIAVNVTGTANVFAAAREAGVRRLIYASSSAVYGDSERLPRKEEEEGHPLSPYALSKLMNEQLADIFARAYDLELVGLRYFNVFGPRQDPKGPYASVIPRFLRAAVQGANPQIYGDGEQTRDFTFVRDVIHANLLAAGAPSSACGRAYNVGAGSLTTINELAARIAEVAGCRWSPEHQPPRPGDARVSQADLSDVQRALGFSPRYTLATGLAETYPFFAGSR